MSFFKLKKNGILLLDKPKGYSSNFVLQKVKKIFGAKKAGHSGSLDPLATGMLPICIGEATKFSTYLLNSNKHYQVIAKFGEKTSTLDSTGKIISIRSVNVSSSCIKNVLKEFVGEIYQIPPMYSAVKHKGLELYKYARKGIEINRKKRKIFIYDLKYVFYDKKILQLEVICSKGTYIRTLIDDLGERLGCGAHVTYLRRFQVGLFSKSKLVDLNTLYTYKKNKNKFVSNYLLNKLLMPMDSALSTFPTINLSSKNIYWFKLGRKIFSFINYSGLVRVTEGENKIFVGVGKNDKFGNLFPIRLISFNNSLKN
ncbi:tRNA pseudouridine(55) synthase TruB [Buchnera aphidicola (Mindarus keteleerifoliae)]|uniref:tRNA pseudouridine(55) synthase TruB n=1 Tax=Buchnera aphidicola TaxID=9 RepID=UPI0031B6E3E0